VSSQPQEIGPGVTHLRPVARRRRAEVLRVAAELFAEKGYEASSTTELAERLGIKGGSVYYYIDSKEALLFELVEDIYGLLLEGLQDVLQTDADAVTKLRRLIDLHVSGMARHHARGALILNETRSLSPEHRTIADGYAATYEEGLASVIADGQRAGQIEPDLDPKLVTKALLGAGNWVNRWYRDGGDWSPSDVSRAYARIFLSGLET
jgi:TetR/AcrR family transcriptional regulator, cholesterol catabolism regulator